VLIDQRKSVLNRSLQSLVIYQTKRANITYEELAQPLEARIQEIERVSARGPHAHVV
jgi:hypothetical protein